MYLNFSLNNFNKLTIFKIQAVILPLLTNTTLTEKFSIYVIFRYTVRSAEKCYDVPLGSVP